MEVAQNYIIEEQPPQILCVLGGPGSGKGTQCERLVRDFKFKHISVGDVMRDEIKSGSKEGLKIKSLVDKGHIVPTEITVGLLLKTIKSTRASRFLIDGFPRGLEQAFFLEQQFRELDFIINFDVPAEVLIDRLTKRALVSGRSDDNPETIKNRIEVFYESTQPVLDAYWRLGKVAQINGLGEIEDIYENVKRAIIPNLIFLYGAPSTGKSTVAKSICQATGYKYLNLKLFYEQNKCVNDNDKINKLMKYLSMTTHRNFIVDSFLDTKAYAVVFINHFGKPRSMIYFQSAKDEIQDNIRKFSKSDIEKQERMKEFQFFLKNRDELLGYFKQFPFFQTINAINTIQNIHTNVLNLIRPRVMAAFTYNNQELADTYIENLEKKLGYINLHVEQIIEEEVQRGTQLGNQMSAFTQSGQIVPAKMQCELLRKIFFYNPNNNKFLLTSFPEKKNEFEVFDQQLFPIDGIVSFMKPNQKVPYSAKINPILHYIGKSKHLIVNNDDQGIFQSYITRRTTFGILVGPSSSGKTTLAKYIAQKHGFILVEWEPTINSLKEKLGPPGEPLEDVPLPKLIDYYRNLFAPALKEKYLFDGFPPGCDKQPLQEQFLSIGQPTWFLHLQIVKDSLWKRFKQKNEMDAAAELTPEDDEKLVAFLAQSESTLKVVESYALSQSNCKLFKCDVNSSLDNTQQVVDYIFEKRVFLASLYSEVSTQLKESIRLVYINLAAQRNMIFVDVEELMGSQANDLSNEYEMRWTNAEVYHPSNYRPELVIKTLKNYLSELAVDCQDVILFGYPAADQRKDHRKEDEDIYPRAGDEIGYIEKTLGSVRALTVISLGDIEYEINDPQWELEKPVEKEVKKVDGEDPQDEPKQDDGEENKVKLNIFDFEWTKSSGRPKNAAQIYKQLKLPQIQQVEASDYSLKMIFDNLCEFMDQMELYQKVSLLQLVKLQQ